MMFATVMQGKARNKTSMAWLGDQRLGSVESATVLYGGVW